MIKKLYEVTVTTTVKTYAVAGSMTAAKREITNAIGYIPDADSCVLEVKECTSVPTKYKKTIPLGDDNNKTCEQYIKESKGIGVKSLAKKKKK